MFHRRVKVAWSALPTSCRRTLPHHVDVDEFEQIGHRLSGPRLCQPLWGSRARRVGPSLSRSSSRHRTRSSCTSMTLPSVPRAFIGVVCMCRVVRSAHSAPRRRIRSNDVLLHADHSALHKDACFVVTLLRSACVPSSSNDCARGPSGITRPPGPQAAREITTQPGRGKQCLGQGVVQ